MCPGSSDGKLRLAGQNGGFKRSVVRDLTIARGLSESLSSVGSFEPKYLFRGKTAAGVYLPALTGKENLRTE